MISNYNNAGTALQKKIRDNLQREGQKVVAQYKKNKKAFKKKKHKINHDTPKKPIKKLSKIKTPTNEPTTQIQNTGR